MYFFTLYQFHSAFFVQCTEKRFTNEQMHMDNYRGQIGHVVMCIIPDWPRSCIHAA